MEDASALEQQARDLAAAGDVVRAIELARRAIVLDPSRMALLDELAMVYARRKESPSIAKVAAAATQPLSAADVDTPLLSALSPQVLAALARRMPRRTVTAGEVIVTEGEPGDCLFILVEGRAAVHRGAQRIALLSDGDFFGELAILTEQPRMATVTAVEDCKLFLVDKQLLSELADVYPSVTEVAQRFARERLADSALSSSEIFAKLPEAKRKALATRFELLTVKDSEEVLPEGVTARGLFVVLTGAVRIAVLGDEVARLGTGEVVGEISTLFGATTTASVSAAGDTLLLHLSPQAAEEALADAPDVKEALEALGQERWGLI